MCPVSDDRVHLRTALPPLAASATAGTELETIHSWYEVREVPPRGSPVADLVTSEERVEGRGGPRWGRLCFDRFRDTMFYPGGAWA